MEDARRSAAANWNLEMIDLTSNAEVSLNRHQLQVEGESVHVTVSP
jgi:hypothetical protein